jgi:ankyrin repeat protein
MTILNAGGVLNYDESTAAGELCELVRSGDADRLQLLIECGCKVNAADYDDRRCAHLAASVGNKTVMVLLFDASADLNCKDRWDGTPLSDAIRHGHLDLAEELIMRGGRLTMDDMTASGELCELARQGKLERLHLLLEGGANIDAADCEATPLEAPHSQRNY